VSDSTGTALGSPSRDGGGADRAKPAAGRSGGGRIRNIGTFYKQVVAELRKVIWPTRKELVTYTTVVVVFVLIITAIVAVFDLAFGKGVLAVFGQ
jgi:preprotein translocase subunit SecE